MAGMKLNNALLQAVFGHFPSLAELFIVVSMVESNPDKWNAMSSDRLRVFSLFVHSPLSSEEQKLGPLFSALTFPSLTDLVLTRPRSPMLRFLCEFLARSRCRLSSLTFTNLSPQDIRENLVCTAALELGEELRIPSVEFYWHLKETRIYRESKGRWYDLDVSGG